MIRKIEYRCGIVAYSKDDGWHLVVEGWRARLLPKGQGWLSNDVYSDLDAVNAAVEHIAPFLDGANELEHRLTAAKQHLLREIMAAGRLR